MRFDSTVSKIKMPAVCWHLGNQAETVKVSYAQLHGQLFHRYAVLKFQHRYQ